MHVSREARTDLIGRRGQGVAGVEVAERHGLQLAHGRQHAPQRPRPDHRQRRRARPQQSRAHGQNPMTNAAALQRHFGPLRLIAPSVLVPKGPCCRWLYREPQKGQVNEGKDL